MKRCRPSTKGSDDIEKMTVPMLWAEIARLKLSAPPKAKTIGLVKIVREARRSARTAALQDRHYKNDRHNNTVC